MSVSFDILQQLADDCGLKLAGWLSIDDAQAACRANEAYLASWQKQGFAGGMKYMQREPAAYGDVRRLLPDARSVLCFVVPYFQGAAAASAVDPSAGQRPGYGRVSRYAWGRDYHLVLKERLELFLACVRAHLPRSPVLSCRICVDAVPMSEKSLASWTGSGFIGRNTLFIWPGLGSHLFLAELIWNLPRDARLGNGAGTCAEQCGSCCSCLQHCPAAALPKAHVLDARKCIAYLTIEKRGVLSAEEQQAIGGWIFGCDTCQEVCPFNCPSIASAVPAEFFPQAGVGPWLLLSEVLALRNHAEFSARFSETSLMRAGRERLLRNACCVAANTCFLPATAHLIRMMQEEPSSVLREQAKMALTELCLSADGIERRKIENALGETQ